MNSVYVFLDESGNFDFSSNNGSTKYFVLTSISVQRPFIGYNKLDDFKYDLIEYGQNIQRFHCAEDNKYVREKVFTIIEKQIKDIRIDSLVVEKSKTVPPLQDRRRFYPVMLKHLLRYVIRGLQKNKPKEIIVITDNLPIKKNRKTIEKAIKIALSEIIPKSSKFQIMHHESHSHYGLQIADYCCWAVFRKWERGKDSEYKQISSKLESEFPIFEKGEKHYY